MLTLGRKDPDARTLPCPLNQVLDNRLASNQLTMIVKKDARDFIFIRDFIVVSNIGSYVEVLRGLISSPATGCLGVAGGVIVGF